jgi:hypothetical protein
MSCDAGPVFQEVIEKQRFLSGIDHPALTRSDLVAQRKGSRRKPALLDGRGAHHTSGAWAGPAGSRARRVVGRRRSRAHLAPPADRLRAAGARTPPLRPHTSGLTPWREWDPTIVLSPRAIGGWPRLPWSRPASRKAPGQQCNQRALAFHVARIRVSSCATQIAFRIEDRGDAGAIRPRRPRA